MLKPGTKLLVQTLYRFPAVNNCKMADEQQTIYEINASRVEVICGNRGEIKLNKFLDRNNYSVNVSVQVLSIRTNKRAVQTRTYTL